MEMLIFIDALRRAKATRITLVVPNMAYSRQDKQKGREPITAKLVAKMISTAGADGLITLDLHADQVAGFYDIGIDNLHGSKLIMEHLKEKFGDLSDWVFASPDAGGAARAEHYAKKLNAGYAISSKRRDYSQANKVEKIHVLGDVQGKKVCIVDDIISSAGTMVHAAREIHKKGAAEIYASATHAIFNKPASERLTEIYEQGILKEVIGIDTVTHNKRFKLENPWFKEVSAAPLLANAIRNINRGLSVSKLYE
jgi:ribose-phosphate pyrophosphokinase